MNNFFDNDTIFLVVLFFVLQFVENLDPWVSLAGGILVIILGIYKIINLHLTIRDQIEARRERKKNPEK